MSLAPISAVQGDAVLGWMQLGSAEPAPYLRVNPPDPSGIFGVPYSSEFAVVAGQAPPYTFTLTSGSLPTGLSMNGVSGAVVGTPTQAGVFTCVVHVTNAKGQAVDVTAIITITDDGAKFIEWNASIGGHAGFVDVRLNVKKGDLIVIYSMKFFRPAGWDAATCTDDQGNSYQGGFCCTGFGGFVGIKGWYAFARGDGTITVSVTQTGDVTSIASVFRNAGDFDQVSLMVGPQNFPVPDGLYTLGMQSGSLSFANSLVVSGMFIEIIDILPPPLHAARSFTGDEYIGNYFDAVMFFRNEHGGNGNVILGIPELDPFGGTQSSMMSMVFSRALERAPGATRQYAMRSGAGVDNQEPAEYSGLGNNAVAATNRPLAVSLPNTPVLGSLVIVAASTEVNAGVMTITDNHGNTYTRQVVSVGPVGCNVVLFTSILTAVPAIGGVLTIKLTEVISGIATIYQTATLAVTEQILAGGVSGITGFGFDHSSLLLDQVTYFSQPAPTVVRGSYIFAYAVYGTTGTSAAWTALAGFTKRLELNYIQLVGLQTNAQRLVSGELADQTALVDGSYTAQLRAVVVNGIDQNTGGIAMLAIESSPPMLACPIAVTASLGVPFSAAMQASGGRTPYSFALTGGAFPPGLSLNMTTGVISGTPTAVGTYNYTITLTDASGLTVTVSCALRIGGCVPTKSLL